MRVLFLCGCLEPGRDGVGDYTRRLALELCHTGHYVSLLSINDSFILEPTTSFCEINDICLPFLRIPSNYPQKTKLTLAREWIDNQDPDWLSLQFVPFSFHTKGIPFGLYHFLKKITSRKNWHIMFHEIWLVNNFFWPNKNSLISSLQKKLISHLIKKLKPRLIHTQAQFSQHRLKKLGFNAELLPLFSNIPVKTRIAKHDANLKNKEIRIVSFGSIYSNSLMKDFANDAAAYQKKYNIEISFTILGNSGNLKHAWISIFKTAGLKMHVVEEQPPEKISEILSNSSIGIASTPFVMIEKSGSVAAMREHGLPIICIADSFTPKDFTFLPEDGIVDYNSRSFEECITFKSSPNYSQTLSSIAKKLINDFSYCV